MTTFEIFYRDLTPEAQKAFLEFEGIKDPSEGNYEVFPIATLENEDPEEEFCGCDEGTRRTKDCPTHYGGP